MIKEAFLPPYGLMLPVKTLPIAYHATHCFPTSKRQDRVDVIGHEKEQRNMPTHLRFVESDRIQQDGPQLLIDQRSLLDRPIQSEADMK